MDDYRVDLLATYQYEGGHSFAEGYFGVSPGDTMYYDGGTRGNDQPAPPLGAPYGVGVTMLFTIPQHPDRPDDPTLISGSVNNSESLTDVFEWPLRVRAYDNFGDTEGTLTVEWDEADLAFLPADYAVQLIPKGNECGAIDMRASSAIQLPAPATYEFIVRATGPNAQVDRPDLAFDLTVAPDFVGNLVLQNSEVEVSGIVRNEGLYTAACTEITLYQEGAEIGFTLAGDLEPGAEKPFTLTLDTAVLGVQELALGVTSANPDADATDNVHRELFTVVRFEPKLVAAEGDHVLGFPGEVLEIPITVRNDGNFADKVSLGFAATETASAWTVQVQPPNLEVPLGQSVTATVLAQFDGTLLPEDFNTVHDVTLSATSKNASKLGDHTVYHFIPLSFEVVRPAEALLFPGHVDLDENGESVFIPVRATEYAVDVAFTRAIDATKSADFTVNLVKADGTVVREIPGKFHDTLPAWNGSVTYAAGEDGEYYYEVSGAIDELGLPIPAVETSTFFVDTLAPTLGDILRTGTKVGDSNWYSSPVQVQLSAQDDSGEYEIRYWLDTPVDLENVENAQVYEGAFVVSGSKAHQLVVAAADAAGNIVLSEPEAILIDAQLPVTRYALTGTHNPATGWYSTPVTVELQGTDAPSGIHQTIFSANSGPKTTYTAPFTLSEAHNVVSYASTDIAGNTEPTRELRFRVDEAPPTVTHLVEGEQLDATSGWYTGPVKVTLGASDATSGVQSLRYRINGGGERDYATPITLQFDGQYNLGYKAADRAGLTSSGIVPLIQIDTSLPQVTLDVGGATGLDPRVFIDEVTLAFAATDTGSGVAEILFRSQGEPEWTVVNEATATVPFTTPGTHTIEFKARDVAGNEASVGTRTFEIDNSADDFGIRLQGTPGEDGWFRGPVTVHLTEQEGGIQYQYQVNGEPVEDYEVPFVLQADGLYELTYGVLTGDETERQEEFALIKIDSTAPTLPAPRVRGLLTESGWYVTKVDVVPRESSDETSGVATATYTLNGGAPQPLPAAGTAFVVGLGSSGVIDGRHTVVLTVTDMAGNVAERVLTYNVDGNAPVVNVVSDAEPVRQGKAKTIQIRATDAFLSQVYLHYQNDRLQFERVAATRTDTPDVFEATITLNRLGAHKLYASATDQAETAGRSSEHTLEILDGRPPSISFERGNDLSVSGTASIPVAATDASGVAGVSFVVKATDGTPLTEPAYDAREPYVYEWETLAKDGAGAYVFRNDAYVIEATATDTAGNTRVESRTYTVGNAALIEEPTLVVNDVEVYEVSASDAVVVRTTILGTTPDFTTKLYARVNNELTFRDIATAGGAAVDLPLPAEMNLQPGDRVEYFLETTDAAGVKVTSGFYRFAVERDGDRTTWTDTTPAEPSRPPEFAEGEEHPWVRIIEARYDTKLSRIAFLLDAPVPADRLASYVTRFDADGDGDWDFELNATHEATDSWGAKWYRLAGHPDGASDGPLAFQARVSTRPSAEGDLDLRVEVSSSAFRALSALAAPSVRQGDAVTLFLSYGSFHTTEPLTLDLAPPVVTLPAIVTIDDNQDLHLDVEFADANFQSGKLFYALNGAAFQQADGVATAAGTYRWTIPATALDAGTLAYFVKADDANFNSITTPTTSVAVRGTVLPSGSIFAPTQVDEGSFVELGVAGLSANAASFDWTFPDGSKASGQTVTHVFDTPGEFVVKLRISDTYGNFVDVAQDVQVLDVRAPVVNFLQPAAGVSINAAQKISVEATDTGGLEADAVKVSIDGGANWLPTVLVGDSYEADFPAAEVPSEGTTRTFVLQAQATDRVGLPSVLATQTLVFDRAPPTAVVAGPTAGAANTPLTFSAVGSVDDTGTVASYTWTFSNGDTQTTELPTLQKSFAQGGTYTLTLTARDAAGNAAQTLPHEFTVSAPISPGPNPGPGPGPGSGSGDDRGQTDDPLSKIIIDDTNRQRAENITGLALPQPFTAKPATDGGPVTTFEDPNGVLEQLQPASTLGNGTLFVVAKKGETAAAFLWDVQNKTIIPVTNGNPKIAPPQVQPETDQTVVRVTVEKAEWIYFTLPDPAPDLPLEFVRAGDGRVLSADRVWRADGFISVLDDPDVTYDLVFTSSDGCPPRCAPEFTLVPNLKVGEQDGVLHVVPTILSGNVVRFEYMIDGRTIVSDAAPFALEFDAGHLEQGVYPLRATAVDANGLTTSIETSYEVGCPPKCPSHEPKRSVTPNAVLGSDKILRVAPDLPLGLVPQAVRYFVDGVMVGESTAPPFDFEYDASSLAPGKYLVRVVAIDVTGQEFEGQQEFEVQGDRASPETIDEGGIPGAVWVMIGLVVIGAIVATVVMMGRRKP